MHQRSSSTRCWDGRSSLGICKCIIRANVRTAQLPLSVTYSSEKIFGPISLKFQLVESTGLRLDVFQ